MRVRHGTLAALVALTVLGTFIPPAATQEDEDVDPLVGIWHHSESEVEVKEDGAGFSGFVTKVPDHSCTWTPGFRVFTVMHESATTYAGEHGWWRLTGDCPFVGYGPSTMELSDSGSLLRICNEFPSEGWSECYTMTREVEDSCPIPETSEPSRPATGRPSYANQSECLEVTGVEVTQGIQNLKNRVSLVKGRRTYVRVHVQSSSGTAKAVDAQLKGRTIGSTTKDLGTISPILKPEIVEKPDRASLVQAYLFRLPDSWTKGADSAHVIEVRFKGIGREFDCKDPVGGCVAYPSFHDGSVPDVVFLGAPWEQEKNGKAILHKPTSKDFDRAARELLSTMPVHNVRYWSRYIKPWIALDHPDDVADFARLAGMATVRRKLDGCPKGASPNCYFAAVVVGPTVDGTVGLANPIGNALGSYIDGSPFYTLSHETAHVAGRSHTRCPEMSSIQAPFDLYPYPDGLLSKDFTGEDAYFGTDVYARPYPSIHDPKKTHDLMSYCHPVWPSDYTWTGLKVGLEDDFGKQAPQAARTAGVGDAMIVSGVTFPDGTAEFNPILRADTEIDAKSDGAYTIEIRDGSGSVLEERSFDPMADDVSSPAVFALSLPYDPAASSVALVHEGTDMASRTASDASPEVTVTSPNGGETISGPSVRFEWAASDADGDALTFAVQYSTDNGETWQTLAFDVQADFLDMDLSDLPGSDTALFRVLASDGFNTAMDIADGTFSTPQRGPELSVEGATDHGVAIAGEVVFLDAYATDLEDGPVPDDAIVWSSSQDGSLGQGRSLELDTSGLTPGRHEIVVTATDSVGEDSAYSFRLNVYASEADVPTCRGLLATLVGTDGPDEIRGTMATDVILGGSGADLLVGRGAGDRLCGEGGEDRLIGQLGRDDLVGGAGDDILKGGGGADVLRGGKGKDRLLGGPARDRCHGDPGRDVFKSCERRRI